MKISRLRLRDFTATFLVLVAAAYYGLHVADVHVPDLGSVRAVAAVVLFLGIAACATSADPELFRLGPGRSLLGQAQMVLGAAALVIGLAAIAFGSELALTTLFAITALLWASATSRHMLRQPRRPRDVSSDVSSTHRVSKNWQVRTR
ncbi:MAG TPA: hypothetical protein VF218_07755 [Acidothermaceae bacterium]